MLSAISPREPKVTNVLDIRNLQTHSVFISMSNTREDKVVLKSALVSLTVFGFVSSQSVLSNENSAEREYSKIIKNFESAYTINTMGCSVPKMTKDDQTVKEYIHYPQNVASCVYNAKPLLQSNQTYIWVDREHFDYYNLINPSKFKCCYRSFHQITSHAVHKLQHEIMYLDCLTFRRSIQVSNEFVKVECYYYDNLIYSQFFLFVPKKNFPDRQDSYRALAKKTSFNVIILGLSSISQVNARRSMPNTMSILKKLGSIDLSGYHAIGDGALENIIPILTGMTTHELNATCWSNAQPMLDSCPFIWEMFSNVGFYTALVQDTARSGIFDSGMYGFGGKPADYYVHPFIREAASNQNLTLKERDPKLETHKICIGDRYSFSFILDYIEMLTDILQSSKLFSFFWESSLSYNLNAPVMMDDEYARLLLYFYETGYLNNTVLLFLSDEGFSGDGILTTKQGRLERRLPLLSILLPPAFRERYSMAYESLKINKNRLTTPFDLHETLVDLSELNNMENSEMVLRNGSSLMYERGMSLFVPIPKNRTCESAGIHDSWCTCHRKTDVGVYSTLTRKAVKYIKVHLNWLLRYYHQCAKLDVVNVTKAEELWPSYHKENEWREFRFTVTVSPGGAVYEALLRRDNKEWSLLGPVQRLDIFTEPDLCSTDDFIKWYCHCLTGHPSNPDAKQHSMEPSEELDDE